MAGSSTLMIILLVTVFLVESSLGVPSLTLCPDAQVTITERPADKSANELMAYTFSTNLNTVALYKNKKELHNLKFFGLYDAKYIQVSIRCENRNVATVRVPADNINDNKDHIVTLTLDKETVWMSLDDKEYMFNATTNINCNAKGLETLDASNDRWDDIFYTMWVSLRHLLKINLTGNKMDVHWK